MNEIREEVWKKAEIVYSNCTIDLPFNTWLYYFTKQICITRQTYFPKHTYLSILALSTSRPLLKIGLSIIRYLKSVSDDMYSQRSSFQFPWSSGSSTTDKLQRVVISKAISNIELVLIENNVSEFMSCYEFLDHLKFEADRDLGHFIHEKLLPFMKTSWRS